MFLLVIGTYAAEAAPRTMRLDYYHTGNASREIFSLHRIVLEPLPWPGNPNKPVDNTNLGKYLFEVVDPASGKVLFSRGFASIYGEWETTDEAKNIHRTFHESLRFPAPEAPVRVRLKKRDPKNAWIEVWSVAVNPKDIFIDPSIPESPGKPIEILKSGDSATKVDLLILGDGYTAAEKPKFERDAKRLANLLFETSPFKERKRDFNVWGLSPTSLESGISRPSNGIHRSSPVGTTYDAFGSERYVLTFDNQAFRRIASFAPYEFVEILVNNQTYGGGGIFGLYSTVAADSLWAPYLFVHEFGHHFAALADEYYTSDVAYLPATDRVEPWEPNVTALLDPANLKWKDLVQKDTPLPTPWAKQAFETYARDIQAQRAKLRKEKRPEAEIDVLFNQQKEREENAFKQEKYFGKVGAFEGAMYEARGYFRPEVDCIMFTRSETFCTVCRRTIVRVIDLYN